MTTPKPNLTIQSGRSQESLQITVEDSISGQPLVNFTLDPDQIWQILGGGYVYLNGDIIAPKHMHRLGKTMVVDSVVYDRKALSASTYDQQLDDAEQLARADRPGWETYSPRRTNTGVVHVTLRRWE